MTYTLFDLSYAVAQEIGDVVEGEATGGAATSIIDTVLLKDLYPDDYFNAGGAWILRDAGGAGASPEGKSVQISDFVKTTGVVTIATVTDAVAAGDRYAICTPKYPYQQIVAKINAALREIPVKYSDTTTIDTAGSQTEYTLPASVLDQDIEVFIQTITGDADNNQWIKWSGWHIKETSIGTAKTLILDQQPPYPFDLRIDYYIPHPPLYASTAKLHESVDLNRVVYDAAYRLLLTKKDQLTDTDPDIDRRLADLAGKLDRAKWHSPTKKGSVKYASLGAMDIDILEEL